jgi:N-acetyl-anhydromuramyl-L-alanine amidase AmpD
MHDALPTGAIGLAKVYEEASMAIRFITIHCAATHEGRDVKAATISAWDIERFGQVSYQYVIELDGNVVQTLPDEARGAHVGGNNTGNIGICYVGGVDRENKAPKDTRTSAQKLAMKALVARLHAQYPSARILGHRDWPNVKKASPSFDVAKWLVTEGLAK